jgi:hypothetical protein
MDWRNYQFWRKDLRRMEKEETEFDLLVQRTKQRIVIGERIGETVRLFQRSSSSTERVSKREIVARKLRNLRQNFPFF